MHLLLKSRLASALFAGLAFTACSSGGTDGLFDAADDDLQFCADENNRYRATLNLPPLQRSPDLEAFAAEGAAYDAERGEAHRHFRDKGDYRLTDAENELPGWPLREGGVRDVVERGLAAMWAEGPGGGHYENMKGDHAFIGCGFHLTTDNKLWVVVDFK